MAGGAVGAAAGLGARVAEGVRRAGQLARRAPPAGRARAPPRQRVAGAPVHARAPVLAVPAPPTLRARNITSWPSIAVFARAFIRRDALPVNARLHTNRHALFASGIRCIALTTFFYRPMSSYCFYLCNWSKLYLIF